MAAPESLVELAFLIQTVCRRNDIVLPLYRSAFEHKPSLMDTSKNFHRYNAACPALVVAASSFDPDESRRLRRDALRWLRADLKFHRDNVRDSRKSAASRRRLSPWLSDRDLLSVRERYRQRMLDDDERDQWEQFWNDVGEAIRLLSESSRR